MDSHNYNKPGSAVSTMCRKYLVNKFIIIITPNKSKKLGTINLM